MELPSVQFHPAPQLRLGRVQRGVHLLEVAVSHMPEDLVPYVFEQYPVHRAASRGVGIGADAVGDLARRLQDGVAVEIVEVPAGGAGLQRELAEGGVQGGQ